MSLLQGADPWDPGGGKGTQGDPRAPSAPVGGMGAKGTQGGDPRAPSAPLGGMGPLGVIPRPFRMEGHAKGPKGAWDPQRHLGPNRIILNKLSARPPK